jgi:predicted transcriptional regulator
MTKLVLHPQEIETFYVLPTLRRYFAQFMKEQGLKQKDVAQLLGINTATISQYSSTKRGHKFHFNQEVLNEIAISAKLIRNRSTYMRETQRLLHLIRQTNSLCEVHKLFSEVPRNCDPVKMGCHHLAAY